MPFILNPTIQVMKNTIAASGIVVLMSPVGDPPNGRPSALNGTIPNWFIKKMKTNSAMKNGTNGSPLGPSVPFARSAM